MSITAKELAEMLGISAAAVSMALNNKPGVSDITRDRVMEAARENGYDFSRLYSRAPQKQGAITYFSCTRQGLVVGETPFFAAVAEGVADACRNAGYNLIMQHLYIEDLK